MRGGVIRVLGAAALVVGAVALGGCVKVSSQTCTTVTVAFDAPTNWTGQAYAISAIPKGQTDQLDNVVGVVTAPGRVGQGTITGLTPGATYFARVYPVKADHWSYGITLPYLGAPVGDTKPFTEPAC